MPLYQAMYRDRTPDGGCPSNPVRLNWAAVNLPRCGIVPGRVRTCQERLRHRASPDLPPPDLPICSLVASGRGAIVHVCPATSHRPRIG